MRKKYYFLLIFALSFSLEAVSQTVKRGPYLQLGTPNSMIIRWRTSVNTDSKVWYGTNPNSLISTLYQSGSREDHEINITGLTPNTKYYYAVGTNTTQLAGATSEHYFYTSPPHGTSQPTSIWVLGDAGKISAAQRSVRDAFYEYNGGYHTDMILQLGDNAYDDGTDAEYQKAWFENMYENTLINTVVWPSIGNHDEISANSEDESGPYYDIYNMPRNGEAGGVPSGTEAYYSFNYANIHVISLNTEDHVSREVGDPMYNWIVEDLAANTQEWTIAIFHKQPYYVKPGIRENFLPVMEAAGVDLVMYGHRHIYRRSFLIDGHYEGDGSFDPATMTVDGGNGRIDGDGAYEKPPGITPHAGTIYMTAGSAGSVSNIATDYDFVSQEVGRPNNGSVIVDVNGGQMDVKFLSLNGEVMDYFTISKGSASRPSVSITNPANGTTYDHPEEINITAQATDPDGTVSRVEFFVDNNSIGMVPSAPYEMNWTPPTTGIYTLRALVTDNEGNIAQSSNITIEVGIFDVCSSISNLFDDAEQTTSSGSMKLTSGDLEIGQDADPQLIGLRFQNLNIPKNAEILSAELKFTVDETNNINPCNLEIRGEANANPAAYTTAPHNITNRPLTQSFVSWAPPDWEEVDDMEMISVKSIVQEIVNQSGFSSNSAMAFVVEGEGKRVAQAFDSNPEMAPMLCIVYANNDTGFECAAMQANIGDPCDDGDICTENDVVLVDCSCRGTVVDDSDGDGVCDLIDQCPGGLEPGMACDDGNPNTYDDEILENCNCIGIDIPYFGSTDVQVNLEDNDVEEDINTGNVGLTSSDLELGYEDTLTAQAIGLRFTDIRLPQGAAITNAYIQFTRDENSIGSASFLIKGEDVDDASIFLDAAYNVSSRVQTSASASWVNVPSWNPAETNGPDQRTVNIASIVQEIVNRSGWSLGNSMAFIITGNGTRTAVSYDKDPNLAPVLHIEYDNSANCPAAGTPCNDGDACTENDMYDADCNCAGTFRDMDNDAVCDDYDICPGGDDRVDTDLDGQPDFCDACPNSATDDTDGDGVCDDLDICPGGDDTIDSDGDGTPDSCDPCPYWAADDADGDGVCDDVDICLGGDDNEDRDYDGVPDFCDLCPDSPVNMDSDGDGYCDDVDICDGGDDSEDRDYDGVPDFCDACPDSATGDTDGDGVCDNLDVCPGGDDTMDNDGDGMPNDCDSCPNSATGDTDGDGLCDDVDACPNSATGDTDGDGVCDDLDVCPGGDDTIDSDGDGTPDDCDPCYDPLIGTACDDGDPFTINDTINASCDCEGQAAPPFTFDVQVDNGSDDVEERENNGSIYYTSSDLELVNDGARGNQTIGIRFNNVSIMPGAAIQKAYVQFTSASAASVSGSLLVQGDDVDNAPPFADVSYNVSTRARTSASVAWNPPTWTSVGERGENQRTADISAIIEEIVGRPGWTNGNSIVIIITGTGTRWAESYEGAPAQGPALHIEYYDSTNCPATGQACDDGDPCTINDVYDANCRCAGTFQDSDNDTVCDDDDICPGGDDRIDSDGDGTPNACDVCAESATDDSDGDGVCDDSDVCPGGDDNLDADGDGTPDACDSCPNSATDDSDGDGICDDVDICIGGHDNVDSDGDGTPDFCDACPNSAVLEDSDNDGVCDDVDICIGGDDNADADGDGTPDFCDACPNSATGDTDGDGVCDDVDACPGSDDALDADSDGTPDACDICPVGDDSVDSDGDGTPDACDSCPNSATGDTDGDGVCDNVDVCPGGDDTIDSDGDGVPNACDACPNSTSPDTDGDNVCDDVDVCPGGDDNIDTDSDGMPDFCDACPNSATGDTDGDGVCDDLDICPGGDDAIDSDGDGAPDACDACPNSATGDTDGDGVCDDVDICPNGDDAIDSDVDGAPDACDACPNSATGDTDGDGVCDDLDACPGSDDALDADLDGTPDACDSCPNSATDDSDNDGVCDDLDICIGGDDAIDSDLDGTPDFCDACPNSAMGDTDGDGVCDDDDVCPGGDDNVDSDSDGTPDFCDDCPNSAMGDTDGDGVCDDLDVCPGGDDNIDTDQDGVPDACDVCAGDDSIDTDQDGTPDDCDSCPNSATDDSDNDGVCDDLDVCIGGDDAQDMDGDGTPDFCDSCDNNLIGTSCDDGDPNTTNDVYDADCNCVGISLDPEVLEVSLTNDNEDAEENMTNGSVDLNSSDLELMFDGGNGGNQTVGICFANIGLPPSAIIEKAYIQFTADKTADGVTNLTIQGEASDHALPFANVPNNISSRPRTSASVNWNVPTWSLIGERGELQRTADIASIIQELVNRPGWTSGNAMAVVITGTGKRTATSYDGAPNLGAVLHIEYYESNCNLRGENCDDGDPCTIDDEYDAFCNCTGTLQDSDNDGVCDSEDLCPYGDDSLDADSDGAPDACDSCPNSATDDSDGDGVCDDVDQCPGQDDTADADLDGTPDACDSCPNSATDDSDGDGICDDLDSCLNGDDNVDSDTDGIPDACDPCPNSASNLDADNDGVCDDVDVCPNGDDKVDTDGDGTPDACDSCPNSASGDTDGDGVCDDVDQCPGSDDALDGDNDGVPDACDSCDGNTAGTVCDDGNPNTVNDVLDADCNCSGTSILPNTLDIAVATGNDDAEENLSAGTVSLGSSDLEMIYDRSNGGNQAVGIRFNNVNLPLNASIESAYIQFTADKASGTSTNLLIQGHAIDHAPTFSAAMQDISGRSRTAANVNWNIPLWGSIGERDVKQRTTDIAPIIQELVNRPGWDPGNSIAVIITGLGKQTAVSFDGDANQAAALHIEYFESSCDLVGMPCDDGNSCTDNDAYNALCECVGQLSDSDGDGVCDDDDVCPNGDDNVDTDSDGTPDDCDSCPNSATGDTDGDGVCDDADQCPGEDDALDSDGDGNPDACDVCPNSATDDSDGDGICDDLDICLNGDDNVDSDTDGIPDACDPCPDSASNLDADNDGVCDDVDVCPNGDDKVDTDGDGTPDDCDSCPNSATGDTDGDGVCDDADQCPGSNDALDGDGDGIPDGCDSCDGNLEGTSCDDNNPNTDDDVIDADCNCAGTPNNPPRVLEVSVKKGDDDAEENASNGAVDLTSSDLELVNDGLKNQTVGIRFNEVSIPSGATITNAYIQFMVDENSTGDVDLLIEGEASDNAATFTTAPYSISTRPRTSASVSWNPPMWTSIGAQGPDQQTNDITAIIQEIIDRPGWNKDNSLAVIITGTGKRTAESYNGGGVLAGPSLHIEYYTNGNCPAAGTACDDGDSGTINDVEDGDCNCAGTPCGPEGSSCDDGDPCTINDQYDDNCNCVGVYEDADNDGYCAGEDIDDTDECIPDNSGPSCDPCVDLSFDDFETGWGSWNKGGLPGDNDSGLSTAYSQSGLNSVFIRDNSGEASSVHTNDLDLSLYSSVQISFFYYPLSFDNPNEDFWLQMSTDGGTTYATIEEWNLTDEFLNDSWYNDVVVVDNVSFTSQMRFRFVCDASANGDQIFLDDIRITACSSSTETNQAQLSEEELGLPQLSPLSQDKTSSDYALIKEFKVEVKPNPFQDEFTLFIQKTEPEMQEAKIQIMDLSGQVIYEQDNAPLGEEFLISPQQQWPDGVYFVRVQNGKYVSTLKLIKQKL